MTAIVHADEPVVLLGAGPARTQDVAECLKLGKQLVAADGGAALALAAGVVPDAVIGDFDSLGAQARGLIPADRLHRVAEQDSTDFEKALTRIAAPLVIGLGFLGGRIDHQLACLHGLLAQAARPCVLLGEREIVFLAPPSLAVPTRPGEVVSLFPLSAASGRSSGLRWPIDGLAFAPGSRIGTSNRATGPIRIDIDAPGLLTILPRRLIQPVVAALTGPDAARWPVRG